MSERRRFTPPRRIWSLRRRVRDFLALAPLGWVSVETARRIVSLSQAVRFAAACDSCLGDVFVQSHFRYLAVFLPY